MKELSLRPFHGIVLLCESPKELHKAYKKRTRQRYPYEDDPGGGRFIRLDGDDVGDVVWLVWAATPHALAHEFAHVLLRTCRRVGHDPTEGDGEPFCYMLSQLLLEANS